MTTHRTDKKQTNIAPIALFAYNRLCHIRQTVEALKRNELAAESRLFVFSDGPKAEPDEEKVRSVREYLKTISGFRDVTIIERGKNFGLARTIITGVTEIVNRYGRIIVVEDDMVTSPYFLKFMNEALDFYEKEEKVISIHGYIYPVKTRLPETFFLRGADCWGWATWKRGWDLFEPDGQKLLNELKVRKLTRRFDFDGSYDYTKMLEDQVAGEKDSWAIRWYASAFLMGKLTLYPGKSLLRNSGLDSSGTHCDTSDIFEVDISYEPAEINKIPVEENPLAREAIKQYFRFTGFSRAQKVLNKFYLFALKIKAFYFRKRTL